jgi:hypothetical protein
MPGRKVWTAEVADDGAMWRASVHFAVSRDEVFAGRGRRRVAGMSLTGHRRCSGD